MCWRFPDLGPHVVFLSGILKRSLTEPMRVASRYLQNHAKARRALKEIVEMPNHQADSVLRSIEQNDGRLAKEMPLLKEAEIWAEIVDAISMIVHRNELDAENSGDK